MTVLRRPGRWSDLAGFGKTPELSCAVSGKERALGAKSANWDQLFVSGGSELPFGQLLLR